MKQNKNKNIFTFSNKSWENNKPHIKSLPSEKQWKNSIYAFNQKNLGNIFQYDKLVVAMSNGFYNMFRLKLEKKLKKNNFHLMRRRFKRLSFRKIFVSRPEIKHSADKILFTFYTYDKQKLYLLNKIKNLRIKNLQKLRNKKNFSIIKGRKFKGNKWAFAQVRAQKRQHRLLILKNKKIKLICKLIKLFSYKREYLNFNKAFYTTLSNNTFNELKLLNKKNIKLNFFKKEQITNINKNNYFTKLFAKEVFNNCYKLLLYINKSKFNENYLTKLGTLFGKLYSKKIEFNIINLKYFYLNSDILTQAIKIKLKRRKNRIVRVLRILINLVSVPKIKSKLSNISFEDKPFPMLPLTNNNFNKLKIDYNSANKKNQFLNLTFFKIISGVKLEASGRLTRRLTASRAISKSRQKGSLRNLSSSYKGLSSEMLRNQFKSNIDMSQLTSNVRNGSFGLKGWLAHL